MSTKSEKNRLNFMELNLCFTEPPPTFVWTHPVHGDITKNSENYMVLYEEYQGGATTTLVINHAGVQFDIMIFGNLYSFS